MLYNLSKNERLSKSKMLHPEQVANTDTRPKRKPRSSSRQDRHLKWRRNYMVTSMPSQPDEVLKLNSLKREEFHSFTQSLHRQTNEEIKRDTRRKKLLRLLRDCAESMQSISCKSYVESMRSCESSESSMYDSDFKPTQDLIILEDLPLSSSSEAACSGADRTHLSSDSKSLSEIVLRDNSDSFTHLGSGEVLYASTDNHLSKRYVTPKLRLANSFCSSYIDDSDLSRSPSEEDITPANLSRKYCLPAAPVHGRSDRYSKLNEYDYRDLVSNGKSTAFLSQNDEELSLYYDDEFDTENSPLGAPLHDSGLEAAICHQYASLLRKADKEFNHHSVNSDDAHSNFSSDFDNIFPADLSSLHADVSTDERADIEEMTELDRSVPNYSDIPAAAKADYQLTFTQAESLYSDARSICGSSSLESEYEEALGDNTKCLQPVKQFTQRNKIPKPPRSSRGQQQKFNDVESSARKVSFSDELAIVDGHEQTHMERMEEIGNSTTWQQMKQNYTTWGQIKCDKAADKKSNSVGDMRYKERALVNVEEDPKRHSLTLWELYKRTHSMTMETGELKTPKAFTEPTVEVINKQQADKAKEELARSINDLLDDALDTDNTPETKVSTTKFDLPDLSFLREDKNNMSKHKWWREVFDQPSFCSPGGASRTSSVRTCSHCERRHSTDQQVILFQGSKPAQYKMCELSMFEQFVTPPPSQCSKCTREKLCDLSSGIATGSSDVTPREPNSWQHIADFLKKRQKNTDANSRGSLNSTLSDQQLLDIVACVEAADYLVKRQQTMSDQNPTEDVLLQIWKLVSSLECVLSMGLKSHKLVTVAMGKIRTRVSIWDIVEESTASAGKLTSTFSQIISEVSRYELNDASLKFCLFIVGLMNFQCLDFWLSVLTHNSQLMDKYYNDDSYLRSKVVADRKLYTEMVQSLQHLSLFTWDIDYKKIITACAQPVMLAEKGNEEVPVRNVLYRQSTISAKQQKTPNLNNTQRYYSANNVRQAVLI